MPTFRYSAKSDDGKVVKGTIDSSSQESALDALKQLKMEPIEVEPIELDRTLPSLARMPQAQAPVPAPSAPPPPPPAPPKKAPLMQRALPVRAFRPAEQKVPVTPAKKADAPPPSSPAPAPVVAPPPPPMKKIPEEKPKTIPAPIYEKAPPPPQKKPKKRFHFFAPRTTDAPMATPPVASTTSGPKRRYVPLLSTLRLYAGWLFAWYALVVTLGYYAHVRTLSFDIPLVYGLAESSLVQSFFIATFLFLLMTTLHRALHGGVLKGIALLVVGISLFAVVEQTLA